MHLTTFAPLIETNTTPFASRPCRDQIWHCPGQHSPWSGFISIYDLLWKVCELLYPACTDPWC